MRVQILAALLLLAVPAVSFAQPMPLTTAGGQLYDFQDDGDLNDGTDDSYDGCYFLAVNGTMYTGGPVTTSADGRSYTFPVQMVGALAMQRLTYVPASGGDYGRFLDTVTNTGTSPATVDITISGNLGSDFETGITATSSGDLVFGTDDDWLTTNDNAGGGCCDPALGHILQGPGAPVAASMVSLSEDSLSWTFHTTVGAGQRVAVLTFAVQKGDTDDAGAEAESTRLVPLPDDAMVGLDDYLADLINFQGDTPGAPTIRFMGDASANEGAAVDVMVTVTDMTGATPTWSWDLDGDGTFGDMPGATDYTVPAGTTDGPSTLRIGVQATNGTATSQRYRTVAIANVAPVVDVTTSPPPSSTSDGAAYGYQIMATDPAGALDPLVYTCTTCPGTMTVSGSGFVSWTPGDADVTMPLMPDHIVITVNDGDMGTTTVNWDLTVLANHPPTRPSTIYPSGIAVPTLMPRFVAGNSTDVDGDALQYFFEIDTVATFDSPGKISSPGIPQTDGFTAFPLTTPLGPGLQYYWRVKANDTMADSEWAMTSFYTAGTPVAADAGVVDATVPHDATIATDAGHVTTPRGGCCATAPGAPGGGPLLLVGFVALITVRRRRI